MAMNLSGNAGVVARVLHQNGYTAPQIAGIIGRLQQESGQGLSTTVVGDRNLPGGSQGIAQWNRERLAGLKKFAGDQWQDPTKQAEYLVHELNTSEKYAGNAIRKASTAQEAATGMMHFERPQGYKRNNPTAGHGYSNTVKNAANVHAALGGNTGLITGEVANALPTSGTTINSLPTMVAGGVGPDVPAQPDATAVAQADKKPATPAEKLMTAIESPGLTEGLSAMAKGLNPSATAAPAQEMMTSSLGAGFDAQQAAMRQQAAPLLAQLLQRKPNIPIQTAMNMRQPMGLTLGRGRMV